MRALDRKLLRDLSALRMQVLAIALVLASGIAVFVMSLGMLRALSETRDAYYDRYRFAEVFAHLKRAPNAIAARIAEIPGVRTVQTRIVADVLVDAPGLDEPAQLRLISVPTDREPDLNLLHLRQGRSASGRRALETVVAEGFAEANRLSPGDGLAAVVNGRYRVLEIVGVALSPEYVYTIAPGAMLPDDRRYGTAWIAYETLAPAFDMDGAFNDLSLALTRDADVDAVIDAVDAVLAPYGGLGAYAREDQLSHRFLTSEIDQLSTMALLVPAIFLAVTAFLMNVVLSRLIGTEREQIGLLRAFGYGRWAVGGHYLKLAGCMALLGGSIGVAAGAWLGRGLTELYAQFFRFPFLHYGFDVAVAAAGLAIGVLVALSATAGAVRRAAGLPPVEAMRPEPPAAYRTTLAERLGMQRLLSPATRMILRQVERRPGRFALSILGVAAAVAVLVLGRFSQDSIDFMMTVEFEIAQRYDAAVTFTEVRPREALHRIAALPGVMRAEPQRSVPVRIHHGHVSRRVALTGLEPDNHLERVVRRDLTPVAMPEAGLVLSSKLADVLGAGRGDSVRLEVLEGARPVREVAVAAVVEGYVGLSAYMDLDALNGMLGDPPLISGAYVQVDPAAMEAFHRATKATPAVAGVSLRRVAVQTFRDTMAENLLRMALINVVFASLIAVGVVYNNARISLAERSRELATLRVLGFTRAEASTLLLGELAVVTVLAIPAGWLAGYGLVALVVAGLETELYTVPLVVEPSTYAFAAGVVVVAVVASAAVVRRRIDTLDLVAVLKSRE